MKAGGEVLLRVPKQDPVTHAQQPLFAVDGAPLLHLRLGHRPYDPACTACQVLRMRARQHRRREGREAEGQLSGDLCGPLPSVSAARNTLQPS